MESKNASNNSTTIFCKAFSEKKRKNYLLKLSTLSNFFPNPIFIRLSGAKFFLALFNLQLKNKIKKQKKNTTKHQTHTYLMHSTKLEADINGTTVNQREKIPGKKIPIASQFN